MKNAYNMPNTAVRNLRIYCAISRRVNCNKCICHWGDTSWFRVLRSKFGPSSVKGTWLPSPPTPSERRELFPHIQRGSVAGWFSVQIGMLLGCKGDVTKHDATTTYKNQNCLWQTLLSGNNWKSFSHTEHLSNVQCLAQNIFPLLLVFFDLDFSYGSVAEIVQGKSADIQILGEVLHDC